MSAFHSHRFSSGGRGTTWVGHCLAAGCGTWYLVRSNMVRGRFRVIVDGPTCPACRPEVSEATDEEGGSTSAADRRPPRCRVSIRLGSTQTADPPRPSSPQLPDSVGIRPEFAVRVLVRSEGDGSRGGDGKPEAERDSSVEVDPVLRRLQELLYDGSDRCARLKEQARQEYGGLVADPSEAAYCCEILAKIANALDGVRDQLGNATGMVLEVVLEGKGVPQPIAKLTGKIIGRTVIRHLFVPVHTVANGLRLAGTAICAASGRSITDCRCCRDLAKDVLIRAAIGTGGDLSLEASEKIVHGLGRFPQTWVSSELRELPVVPTAVDPTDPNVVTSAGNPPVGAFESPPGSPTGKRSSVPNPPSSVLPPQTDGPGRDTQTRVEGPARDEQPTVRDADPQSTVSESTHGAALSVRNPGDESDPRRHLSPPSVGEGRRPLGPYGPSAQGGSVADEAEPSDRKEAIDIAEGVAHPGNQADRPVSDADVRIRTCFLPPSGPDNGEPCPVDSTGAPDKQATLVYIPPPPPTLDVAPKNLPSVEPEGPRGLTP